MLSKLLGEKLWKIFTKGVGGQIVDTPPLHPNCFIDGQTPIFTSKGWIPIRNISIGDLVLTHKGRFRKVTQLIRTPMQKPEVTRIKISKSGYFNNFNNLTVTSNHKILIGNDWVEAGNLKVGDCISYLSSNCNRCKIKIPFYRKYCSYKCCSLDITDKQWASEEHRKLMSSKISKKNKEQYVNGERDRFKQTKKCRAVSNLRIKTDNWFNYPETRQKMIASTNTPEQRKQSSIRMKLNNPSRIPEVREKMTKSYMATMLAFPEKHPNVVMAKKGFISSLEKKMKVLLEELGQEFIHQFPIKINQFPIKQYFADFLLSKYKLVIEVDGSYWHNKSKDKDVIRQKDIENEGFMVIRFDEKDLKKPEEVKNEIKRVINNHDGKYDFLPIEIKEIKQWVIKKNRTLFNFSVEEDESYIAKGFIVHNCRCVMIPIIDPEYLPENTLGAFPGLGQIYDETGINQELLNTLE
jgi:very-short-patch-repair endonuclease